MKQQSSHKQQRKKPNIDHYFVNEERASVAVPLRSAILTAKNQHDSPKLKDNRSFDAKLDAFLLPRHDDDKAGHFAGFLRQLVPESWAGPDGLLSYDDKPFR
jgi:hypothetical protein